MQDRIGESYVGSITAVTSFGIFVTLDDLFVEGLVHISELGKDYFHHDEARHELLGERTGQRYRLSDRVSVQLVRVDLESRKIDFKLLEGVERATTRTGKTERDHARATPVEPTPAAQRPERQHAKPKRLLDAPVVKEAARPERKAVAAKTQPIVIDDDDDVVSWRKLAGLPDRKGPLAIAADVLPTRGPRGAAATSGRAPAPNQPKSRNSGNAKPKSGQIRAKQANRKQRPKRHRRPNRNPLHVSQWHRKVVVMADDIKGARFLHGFHAVAAKLRHDAESVLEIFIAAGRHDARARDLVERAETANVRVIPTDAPRLDGMAGTHRHQGVVARVDSRRKEMHLDDVLDTLTENALFLVLDGVQDPHNLGACLRVADAAGAHAVIAPKDRAAGLNDHCHKGCQRRGRHFCVPTSPLRTWRGALREMQEAGVWCL